MDKIKDNDFLDTNDVAEILGLSVRTIRELFRTNKIKSKKIGGKYFTTRDIIKKYIESED